MNRAKSNRTSVFIGGTEVLGFILYGLWPGVFESIDGVCGKRLPLGKAECHQFRLFGDGWTILGSDVGFHTLDAYLDALSRIETFLDAILQMGAHVAWVGCEGLPFADPPNLFTVEWMEGGVLAGKTQHGVYWSGVDVVNGHCPLDNQQMRDLEEVARYTCEDSEM